MAQDTTIKRDWITDPAEITRRSFVIVEREADLGHLDALERGVAVRLIHACGMTDIAADLRLTPNAVAAGRAALASGAPVLVDVRMVEAGITRARLPHDNRVICTLGDARVPALANKHALTRSAVAVDLWTPHLAGAVVAIGNAPTALFRLLELLADGAPPPISRVGRVTRDQFHRAGGATRRSTQQSPSSSTLDGHLVAAASSAGLVHLVCRTTTVLRENTARRALSGPHWVHARQWSSLAMSSPSGRGASNRTLLASYCGEIVRQW